MAQSVIEHGRITTTVSKAKTIRPFVERLVRLAVRCRTCVAGGDRAGALRARRAIEKLLGDRAIVPREHQATYAGMSDAARDRSLRALSGRRYRTGDPKGRLAFTAESVIHRLIERVAPRFEQRPGGYTRLVPLPRWRVGDSSPLAIVQLLGGEEAPTSLTKPRMSARRRRADSRYALAVKAAKAWSARVRSGSAPGGGSGDAPPAAE